MNIPVFHGVLTATLAIAAGLLVNRVTGSDTAAMIAFGVVVLVGAFDFVRRERARA